MSIGPYTQKRKLTSLGEAMGKTVARLARGSLRNVRPEDGACEDCGCLVEPIKVFGRWHLPSVCGELWAGPGYKQPVGCMGRRDYEDHIKRVEGYKLQRADQAMENAKLDEIQVRRARATGEVIDTLKGFIRPKDRKGDDSTTRAGSYGAFLYGDYGTGKSTQLILACLYYLDLGWSVRYATQEEILASLRPDAEKPRTLEYWARFDLLAVDELAYGLTTDWQRSQIFAVVDARYRSRKPLFMASNYTLDEMLRRPDFNADMTPYLGQRTVDRIMEMTGMFGGPEGDVRATVLQKVWRRSK